MSLTPSMELGINYDGHQPRRSSFQWTPDQTPFLPPSALLTSQSTRRSSVDNFQLPQYILVTPFGEAQPQQLAQSSFRDVDAWADTNWPPPQPVAPPAAQVPELRAKRIDHFLGKPRPSTPSDLQTSLTRCIATAKTACLTFLVLCIVALCVLMFSVIGERPAVTARSVEDGTAVKLRIPTAVLKEQPVTADLPTSVEKEESTNKESQANALVVTVGSGNSMGDAQARFLGRCEACRSATRRAVRDVDLEERHRGVNGDNASSRRSQPTKTLQQRLSHSLGAFPSVGSTSPDAGGTPSRESAPGTCWGFGRVLQYRKGWRHTRSTAGVLLNAAGPTGAPAPTATARAASSAAPGDGADEVDLWEDHSWQRCLIVYVILVGIIGLALIVFVTVGSTAKHHGLEQTTRRAFTRINPQAKVLASSNESSRLPSPVTVEGDHVAHVPTAAATLVDEGDDAEEDTTTEN
ncbi:hypothetical protein MTO96_024579 [Rhipicephalus appendiculatus]